MNCWTLRVDSLVVRNPGGCSFILTGFPLAPSSPTNDPYMSQLLIVKMSKDPSFGSSEPDSEIMQMLKLSGMKFKEIGINMLRAEKKVMNR